MSLVKFKEITKLLFLSTVKSILCSLLSFDLSYLL